MKTGGHPDDPREQGEYCGMPGCKDTAGCWRCDPIDGDPRDGQRTDGSEVEDYTGEIDGGGYKRSMDDPEKPPMSLIPRTFKAGMARVLGQGAEKYSRGNWMRGMSFSEVLDAMERHLDSLVRGEDVDPDSGENHLFHIGCCAAFLSEFMEGPRAEEYAEFDDRLEKIHRARPEHGEEWAKERYGADMSESFPVPLDNVVKAAE